MESLCVRDIINSTWFMSWVQSSNLLLPSPFQCHGGAGANPSDHWGEGRIHSGLFSSLCCCKVKNKTHAHTLVSLECMTVGGNTHREREREHTNCWWSHRLFRSSSGPWLKQLLCGHYVTQSIVLVYCKSEPVTNFFTYIKTNDTHWVWPMDKKNITIAIAEHNFSLCLIHKPHVDWTWSYNNQV